MIKVGRFAPRVTLTLVAIAIVSAIGASPALAEAGWGKCIEHTGGLYKDSACNEESGGGFEFEGFTAATSVKEEGGKLTFEDSKLGTKVECEIDSEGTGGPGAVGEITKVTTSNCKSVKGACIEGSIKGSAVNLPWKTELETIETEMRNEILNGTSTPGWTVECNTSIGKITDTCTGETTTSVNDVTGGVEVGFDSKSPKGDCTVGGADAGIVEGKLVFKSAGIELAAKGIGHLVVNAPNPPSLKFQKAKEKLEIEIEYKGAGASGNLQVGVINETEGGAYIEETGGNCVGKSYLDKQKCKFKIELVGKVGAGGSVVVTGRKLVIGTDVTLN
jgi:hypothetical protein